MNNLIDALRALPPGVGDYLETPLEFTEIPYPNSAETGNIASGQAAAMLNNQLLVPFSGYTPIEGFLRIGQYNPVIQGILLASIEYDDSGSTGPTLEDIQAGFREALKRLPPSLSDLLSTPIPEISPVGMPGTEEEAALVTGQVSSNVIKVFAAFSGLMPVALLLRVGMYSNPLHALLFSGLEWSGDKKKILPIEPADEGVYYGSITEWIVDAHSATSVSVTSDDAENYDGGTFDLEPVDGEDNRWSALWAVPIGTHTATITAEYGEDTAPESVEIAFEIVEWPLTPEDGSTVGDDVLISVDPAGDERIQSVSVDIHNDDGDTTTVELNKVGEIWEVMSNIADIAASFGKTAVASWYITYRIGLEYIEVRKESQIFWENFEPPPA